MKIKYLTLIPVVIILFSVTVYADEEEILIDSEYYGPLWDCNHNGMGDYLDVSLICAMYGASGSPPDTWSRADINNDGVVNYLDVSGFSPHYLEVWVV